MTFRKVQIIVIQLNKQFMINTGLEEKMNLTDHKFDDKVMLKITDEMVCCIVGKPTYKPVLITVPICFVIGVLVALFSNEKDAIACSISMSLTAISLVAIYCNIQVGHALLEFKIVKNALETGEYKSVYGGLIYFHNIANIVKKHVGFTDYEEGIHRVIYKSGTTHTHKSVDNLIPTYNKWLELQNDAIKIKIATIEEKTRMHNEANKRNAI